MLSFVIIHLVIFMPGTIIRYIVLILLTHISQVCFASPPWFTGPLINNGAIVVDKGQWDNFTDFFQTQLNGLKQFGAYSQTIYGITSNLQIQFIPVYNRNTNGQVHNNGWGDLPLLLGYQLYRQHDNVAWPSIKLDLVQIVPTGRYKDLNIDNQTVDGFGAGANHTELVINTEYLSTPIPEHYLNTSFSLGLGHLYKTHVTGLNVYGGGTQTDGEIAPSWLWNANLAFEFQLTQHWVTVFEVFYLYQQAGTFTGEKGLDETGNTAAVSRDPTNQWSLAPAIEYGFSEHFGIIAGVWFSLNDNQINQFRSMQIALNYRS